MYEGTDGGGLRTQKHKRIIRWLKNNTIKTTFIRANFVLFSIRRTDWAR